MIAYMHPDEVAGQFCDNLADLCLHDGGPRGRKRILQRASIAIGPRPAEGRNSLMHMFRACVGAKWIWMIDADMSFTDDLMYRMVDVAESDPNIHILGALCFSGGRDPIPSPVMYSEPSPGTFARVNVYPEGRCKVAAIGAACMLISREAAEDIYRKNQERAHPWFEEMTRGKDQYGEDIGFSIRAREAGYDLIVDTTIEVGHMKMAPLHSGLYKILRDLPPHEKLEYERSFRHAMGDKSARQ